MRSILTIWLEKAQDAAALLRGVLLDEAAAWSQTRQVDLSEQEQAFIVASQRAAQREVAERLAAQQALAAAERRRAMLWRQGLVVVTLFLVMAVGAELMAWRQSGVGQRPA